MNLISLNNRLKSNQFAKTKCNYWFMQKIVLFNKAGNFDMPVTENLSSIEYKMAKRLVDKYFKTGVM